MKICACLGLLTPGQAADLKRCGVDRVNHNINTSENYYGQICSTHTYQDRIDTLEAVRKAGLEICSGGIIGMGEQPSDVVRMAFALRDVGAESIPVNFFNPIDGTALADTWLLTPQYCLKVLAMFRLVNPDREIRVAGEENSISVLSSHLLCMRRIQFLLVIISQQKANYPRPTVK